MIKNNTGNTTQLSATDSSIQHRKKVCSAQILFSSSITLLTNKIPPEDLTMSLTTGLPPNWTIKVSKTHDKEYFLNQATKESSWDPPYGTDTDALKDYLRKFKENGRKPVINKDGKIRASHILTKHKNSRNPKSWRNPEITITREEAIQISREHLSKLLKGEATFNELAETDSDCSSHGRAGDLGFFGKKEMQPAFESAEFNLHVGELSDLVETYSGIHIIHRTG